MGITNEADIFPALTGACWRYVQKYEIRLSKSDYLAGLWRTELRDALTWYVCSENRLLEAQPSPSRPKAYRAPSWSWASLNRCVKHGAKGGDSVPSSNTTPASCILVIEASVQLSTPNPFGAISSAYLKLGGFPVTMRWAVRNPDCDPKSELDIFDNYRTKGVLYPDEYPSLEQSGEVLCLPLFGGRRDRKVGKPPCPRLGFKNGITLKEVQGGYMRTGSFESDRPKWFQAFGIRNIWKSDIVLI
jgi:hypothetical protein